MDRVIENKKGSLPAKIIVFFVLLGIAGLFYFTFFFDAGSKSVNLDDIKTYRVSRVSFGENINFVGEVQPKHVYFVDAVEGGVVKTVSARNGQIIKEGESIVELSNSALLLQVIRSEAEISQQVNNLNNLEIELERNRLTHLKNILETDHAIMDTQRTLQNLNYLENKGVGERDKIKMNEDELSYLLKKKKLLIEAQKTDLRIQSKQMAQLTENTERLKNSLEYTKENLSSLNVVAPTSGLLTDFYLQKGQSLNKGDRIARIDNIDEMVLVAQIDEFYSSSLDVGNTAIVKNGEHELMMNVSRIYPEINNGTFRVDLTFKQKLPADVKRGRQLTGKILLQDKRTTLAFPNKQIVKYTADNWVFVLSSDRKTASKRFIKAGARNETYVEVKSGLVDGEEIIVSSYKNFQDQEHLILK